MTQLNHLQIKKMGEIIREHGGAKNIRAMPLEEKLMVRNELVQWLRPDIAKASPGPDFLSIPSEEEVAKKRFDKEIKCIEIHAESTSRIIQKRIEFLAEHAVAIGSAITGGALAIAGIAGDNGRLAIAGVACLFIAHFCVKAAGDSGARARREAEEMVRRIRLIDFE